MINLWTELIRYLKCGVQQRQYLYNDKNIDIFIQTNLDLPSSLEAQTTLKSSVQNNILSKLLNMDNITDKCCHIICTF